MQVVRWLVGGALACTWCAGMQVVRWHAGGSCYVGGALACTWCACNRKTADGQRQWRHWPAFAAEAPLESGLDLPRRGLSN